MTSQVTVILVAYNTKDLILRCLARLPADCDVVVVDNASGDGTAEAIEALFTLDRSVSLSHAGGRRILIRSADNLGFGRAVNLAADAARTPYLLLLNPDTEPVGTPVAALVTYAADHPQPGIYAGRTLRADHSDDERSCFGLPSLWGYVCFATGLSSAFRRSAVFNPEELPRLDRSVGGPVPAVSGCVVLIDRALFTQLGGFDPRYFMYSEDIDLSLRAGLLGRQPVLVPEAKVVHVGGASSSSATKRVMVLRGKVTYVRLRWSAPRAGLATILLRAGVWLRARVGRGWAEVWARRAEWAQGWPEPAPRLAPTTTDPHP